MNYRINLLKNPIQNRLRPTGDVISTEVRKHEAEKSYKRGNYFFVSYSTYALHLFVQPHYCRFQDKYLPYHRDFSTTLEMTA